MGWGIAGGVLGIVLMFGAWKWLTSYAGARTGGTFMPTIGSRPRRLAGVPEEAPADAIMPPGMEVLRYGEAPVVLPDVDDAPGDRELEAPYIVENADDRPIGGKAEPASVATRAVDEPSAGVAAAEPTVENEVVTEEVVTIVEGAASGIIIAEVHHGDEEQGEHILIENTGPNPVALDQWRIADDGDKHEYSFTSLILQPGAAVRVHMWRGEDTETDVYVGRRSNWWNDGSDTAYLYDAAGVLVHSVSTRQSEDGE